MWRGVAIPDSLSHFYDDVRATFPELELYCVAVQRAHSDDESEDDEGSGTQRPHMQQASISGGTWQMLERRA